MSDLRAEIIRLETENEQLRQQIASLENELEKLRKLKVERANALAIGSRKGTVYAKYIKDMDFLKYMEETNEVIYKEIRKEWLEYREVMGADD